MPPWLQHIGQRVRRRLLFFFFFFCESERELTGTQTLHFFLRVDEYPMDHDFPDLLLDQRNASHLTSAARNARRGFQVVPIPRIAQMVQMVHVGQTHVRLARVEVDDPVVSFPLVHGVPQRGNPTRGHSDVVAEVRKAPFGRDHPDEIPTDSEVQSRLSRVGGFSAHVQDSKVHLVQRLQWERDEPPR